MGAAVIRQPGIRSRTLGTPITGGKHTLSAWVLVFPAAEWFGLSIQ